MTEADARFYVALDAASFFDVLRLLRDRLFPPTIKPVKYVQPKPDRYVQAKEVCDIVRAAQHNKAVMQMYERPTQWRAMSSSVSPLVHHVGALDQDFSKPIQMYTPEQRGAL